MSTFGLYVKFRAHPGQRDALVAQLLGTAQLAGDAAGCELYIVNTSPTEDDAVWVTEIWRSRAHHDAALAIEGARASIERTRPLLAGPPEQIAVVPVGGKGLAAGP